MTQEEGFLRAIRDEPEDDAVRLIFADWLEERGDPRGTLLRLQVTRARLPEYDPRCGELEQQEKELLESHGAELWLGPLLWRVRHWRFQRGLLHVEADGATFFNQPLPVSGAACWVERLNLWNVSGEHLAELTRFAHRAALTMLDLHFGNADVGTGAGVALADAATLAPLRWLDLSRNVVGDRGVRALAESPYLTRLTALHLSVSNVSSSGAAALAHAASMARLTILDLSYNRIGDAGAAALAESPHLTGLTALYLSGNRIGRAGAQALARSPSLDRLEALHLSGNNLDGEAVTLLHERFGGAARC